MTTSNSDVIKIVESSAELRANQRVGWGIKFTGNAIWLKAENSSSHKINIISPSGDDWVSLDRLAWNSCCGETLLEPLPGLSKSNFLAILVEPIANEGVLSIAV